LLKEGYLAGEHPKTGADHRQGSRKAFPDIIEKGAFPVNSSSTAGGNNLLDQMDRQRLCQR
jgi:hypothetical protein